MSNFVRARLACVLAVSLLATACSNGRGSVEESGQPQTENPNPPAANPNPPAAPNPPAGPTFTIGGEVQGLQGSGLVLRNNGGDDLPIALDGPFVFTSPIASGARYDVAVAKAPASPAQTCSIQNNEGAVQDANVSNILVVCSTNAFQIGGSVNGATGPVVLELNGELLTVESNQAFQFPTAIASGATYLVRVQTPPPGQNCTVANDTGVIGNGPISNVNVTCQAGIFTVGGAVSGLAPNAVLELRLRAGQQNLVKEIRANGPYTFTPGVPNGAGYVIDVSKQPANPAQDCVLSNPTGIVSAANVANANVRCTTRQFTVGGRVNDYRGSGLVLRLNGGNGLAVASNGSFTFPAAIPSGSPFEVSVAVQPSNPAQTCTPNPATGRVGAGPVTNIVVNCAVNTYRVGGTVQGLAPGNAVVLRLNGGATVRVESDGAFSFAGVPSGSSYAVDVATRPANPSQSCSLTNQSGTVGAADVANIAVVCTTDAFNIRGAVEGLVGSGLALLNSATGEQIAVSGSTFSFPTAVLSGQNYSVSVVAQPAGPQQVCEVLNGAGTVSNQDVVINVRCTTATFAVSGAIDGLGDVLGFSNSVRLQLLVNGQPAESTSALGNGPFSFAPIADGSAFEVTVLEQPAVFQTCSVVGGSGTISSAPVANVSVTCQ